MLLLSIFSVKDGVFRKYEGSRSLKGFIDFIKDQKWRDIEPVPWWKSPGSYLYVQNCKFAVNLIGLLK